MLFRRLAHLEEQLGHRLFQVLLDPANTGRVRKFCKRLLKDSRPTEMTVGGGTYDILDILREDETSVSGDTMVERAEKMSVRTGEDDGRHCLKHQGDIPKEFRGDEFVFINWRNPKNDSKVAIVRYYKDCWILDWVPISRIWFDNSLLLRRK